MGGCLVQNTMNTFSEARYYLNINIMAIFDHHSNLIAAALELELYCPVKELMTTKAVNTTQSQYIGTMQTPI